MHGGPNEVTESSTPGHEPTPDAERTLGAAPTDAERTLGAGPTGAERVATEAELTVAAAGPTSRRTPASVLAVFLILLIGGGALEGYAMSLAASSDPVGRQYTPAWAFLGAALVVTAWALRARRWWGAAAAIAVSIVGLFAGMYGVYGMLVLANGVDCAADATGRCPVSAESWLTGVGLIAVGAAAIAIIGLLSSAWGWLTATGARRPA
jgi:hypothetical protein